MMYVGFHLTMVIHSIDICMAVHQFLHHALHCQSGCQDEWRGAVIHTGIKIRGTVTDKNLEFKNTIMIGMC